MPDLGILGSSLVLGVDYYKKKKNLKTKKKHKKTKTMPVFMLWLKCLLKKSYSLKKQGIKIIHKDTWGHSNQQA